MRVIDARTGKDVHIGETIVYDAEEPNWYRILEVKDRLMSVSALMEGNEIPRQWLPLQIRYTHPGFLFQRVAFVPT